MISGKRLSRICIAFKPATILKYHRALVKRKYRLLYSAKSPKKPGPKGPDQAVIDVIIEMKRRNPRYGYLRIAMQVSSAFGIDIDKDVVRRVLQKHFKDIPGNDGPSWLTFLCHMKDSLWSLDLFRCESIHLNTHWVMIIMDQFTRRIIGFAVHKGDVTGIELCCMFNKIMSQQPLPKYISSDRDPLFTFHRWKSNLRILDIEEIKTVPYTPISHPFVERLIGSVRRELLDQTFFWNANDLQRKLDSYQQYFNNNRCHRGVSNVTPLQKAESNKSNVISIEKYQWEKECGGLFQLPIAA